LSDDLISVEIMERPKAIQFKPYAVCVFTCLLGNRPLVFVTSVKDFHADSYPEVLIVAIPDEVASESRSSFRVPVLERDRPLVAVSHQDQRWEVAAVNLSVTGILVEFPSQNVPELEVGEEVSVQLKLEDEELALRAEVRRKDKNRVGLFFFEVWKGEQLDPPDELAKIVRRVEMLWFHRKAI
jgi:hypothetical protein